MDLEKVQQQWEDYREEFNTTGNMDIKTHTRMAFRVGGLLQEIKRLQDALEAKHSPPKLCWRCGRRAKELGRIVCEECYRKQFQDDEKG